MTSDVCLSVAYIGPKSRTERPRKTKVGTEVTHVTRDSDTTFKVKGQLAGGGCILWWPPAHLVTDICSDHHRRHGGYVFICVCLVCEQDFSKTTDQMFMELLDIIQGTVY